jgi:aspartyl-tRNA(Asn)/glutamyl-tRNA(Gln) amidotransferase subunit A
VADIWGPFHGASPARGPALIEATLAAIDASQPVINAFVTVDHDGARTPTEPGPLHGIPVAVKDIVDTAGLATTMGSRHFAGHVPTQDADVVTRLRAAGAVIVGKTTTHEFAYGPTGDIAANGPATNPYDPTRMAGGSSAGSAAAVGAGLVPLAVGTDTGGSVRIPAALCGAVGIRPSFGRVPTDGVFPLSWSLDTTGVIAVDVATTALGWRILAGAGSGGVDRAPEPTAIRIGLVDDPWFDRLDPTVREAVDAFVIRLRAAGVPMIPVPFPDAEELSQVYRLVQSAEAFSIHYDRLRQAPELFQPETLDRIRTAGQVQAYEYARALRQLTTVRAGADDRFTSAAIDLMLTPTVPILAPPAGVRDTDLGGGWTQPRDALLAHNSPFSVLGLPALSIPIAAGPLPVGVQLVARPGRDEELLAAAAALEPLACRGTLLAPECT